MTRFLRFLKKPRADLAQSPRPMLPDPPILFIHIPKTAGTSLRKMLQASLGMSAVYPSDEDLSRRRHGLYPSQTEILKTYSSLRHYSVLTGHFDAAFAEQLPVRHRTATLLRCPVQRSLSLLAHMSKKMCIPTHRLINDRTIVEGHIRNHQTSLLGTQPGEMASVCPSQILDNALKTIDSLDFVGLTEQFQDSCELFDATFGTTLCSAIRRDNVLRPNGVEHEELIPRILALVEMDQLLYAHATKRFRVDRSRVRAMKNTVHRAA